MSNSATVAEQRLDRFATDDRSLRIKLNLFPETDCEAFIGRDDTGGRYEGRTVYEDLSDCADEHDWTGLADWLELMESSDCDDPTIY